MTKKDLILIGAHVSIAGGVHRAIEEGTEIQATVIQIFTANQRQWNTHLFNEEEIKLWEQAKKSSSITHIMSHSSYLINLGSPDKSSFEKSKKAFEKEISRSLQLKLTYLTFHPGAALTSSTEECLDKIIEALLSFEPLLAKDHLTLLLETTAGQGSCVGHSFDQLGYILSKTAKKIKIGICMDTCHVFAAGYDISTDKGFDSTLKDFDEKIGLKHLKAFHVNDSLNELGSRKDRHASIGKGKIGIHFFKNLMTHPHTKDLPKYLETPIIEEYKNEIQMLKNFATKKR